MQFVAMSATAEAAVFPAAVFAVNLVFSKIFLFFQPLVAANRSLTTNTQLEKNECFWKQLPGAIIKQLSTFATHQCILPRKHQN